MNRFPEGKKFAFTVFDDTDHGTVQNVGPVYRFLAEQGFRTSKSVWSLPSEPGVPIGGQTLEDPAYLEFIRGLRRQGFEIACHSVRNVASRREDVERGLERFKELMGEYPVTLAQHLSNRENVYWGVDRLNQPVLRLAYNLATKFKRASFFAGHVEDSPHFWGDLCQQRIRYVRNFVFDEINLDRVNPSMPYFDPRKPHVNAWYSSSDGGEVEKFCKTISEKNQERLEREGGVCIMYTHFANGFCVDGKLHPEFERLMKRLSRRGGWFVPVGPLLDRLAEERKSLAISRRELGLMELRWFVQKLMKGTN